MVHPTELHVFLVEGAPCPWHTPPFRDRRVQPPNLHILLPPFLDFLIAVGAFDTDGDPSATSATAVGDDSDWAAGAVSSAVARSLHSKNSAHKAGVAAAAAANTDGSFAAASRALLSRT